VAPKIVDRVDRVEVVLPLLVPEGEVANENFSQA